jgi:hypothetical protein
MAGKISAGSNLVRIAQIFQKHAVDFIVIGAQAENIMGHERETADVDFCYRRTLQNLDNLAEALKEIRPTVPATPPELPVVFDVQALSLAPNYTFETPFGLIHLLGWVEPIGSYDDLAVNAKVYPAAQLKVKVIGVDDLIKIREYLDRGCDREALPGLLALKRSFGAN